MMTLELTPQEIFSILLESLRAQHSEDPLAKLRTLAWECFSRRGLPTSRDEVFRYVTLRRFFQKEYTAAHTKNVTAEAIEPYILPECKGAVAVFINGYFDENLSTIQAVPNVVMMPLAAASRTYGAFLTNQWQRSLKEENDPFAAINAALHPAGAFIYIPPASSLSCPLQILSIVDTGDEAMLLMPRTHIFVGSGATATLVTRTAFLSGQNSALMPAYEIALEENSRLDILQMAINDRNDVWLTDSVRATLKRGATFNAANIVHGGEGSRHDYHVALLGENGTANLAGLAMLKGSEEAHVHCLIEHLAPHCNSLQLFKNVLNDSSLGSFEGKIFVDPIAQKTDAFQLNNNLLLSDGAQAKSKPNLEIFADDVKASHGTTMGQLDDEQFFYLQARGLDKPTAHHILIKGFCRAVLDQFTAVDSVAREAHTTAANYIAAI